MGAVRKFPGRYVVELEMDRLLKGPVWLKSRTGRLHRLEHSMEEVIGNMLWNKLWKVFPDIQTDEVQSVTITYDKARGTCVATFLTSETPTCPPSNASTKS
jgi:hypothetical protein